MIRIFKRCDLLSKKVLLQHDNARPYVAKETNETVNKLGFEVLKHLAYSPDIFPSHYHLFALLKDALRGRKFSYDCSFFRMNQLAICAGAYLGGRQGAMPPPLGRQYSIISME